MLCCPQLLSLPHRTCHEMLKLELLVVIVRNAFLPAFLRVLHFLNCNVDVHKAARVERK